MKNLKKERKSVFKIKVLFIKKRIMVKRMVKNRILEKVPNMMECEIPLCLNILEYSLKGRVKNPFIEKSFYFWYLVYI